MHNWYLAFFITILVTCVTFAVAFSIFWVYDGGNNKKMKILSNSFSKARKGIHSGNNKGNNKNGNRKGNKSLSTDCTTITSAILESRPELPATSKICLNGISYEDLTRDEQKTYVYKDPHFDGTNFYDVLIPRGENDLIVELDKVVGSFYGVYLQFESDMWSDGFDTGDNKNSEQKSALVNDMKTKSSLGIPLIGEIPTSTSLTPQYTFDTSVETQYNIRTLSNEEKAKLKTISGEKLKGTLRIASAYHDYYFKLNGKEKIVRVMMSPPGEMGDKALVRNGVTNWLNYATKTFSETRPTSSALSFWSGQQSRTAYFPDNFQSDNEEQDSSAFINLFKNQRIGMPIAISSSSPIDFTQLNTKNMTLDLKVDGFIGFNAAKQIGLTEADLDNNEDQMLVLYDMPDLNLKAEIAFTE